MFCAAHSSFSHDHGMVIMYASDASGTDRQTDRQTHTYIHLYIHSYIHTFIQSYIHSYIQRAYVRHAQHEARHATVPTQVCVAAVSQTLTWNGRLGQVFVPSFIRRARRLKLLYIFVTDVEYVLRSFSS